MPRAQPELNHRINVSTARISNAVQVCVCVCLCACVLVLVFSELKGALWEQRGLSCLLSFGGPSCL